jgi:hypothetical protein
VKVVENSAELTAIKEITFCLALPWTMPEPARW